MKETIIILTTAAALIFGYFIMKKLDTLLEKKALRISENRTAPMLRIAFDNLLYLALISELLENFIKENPDCGVSLLTGTSKHIIHKLKADEIDFGFIAAEYDDNFYEGYHSVTLLFMQGKTVFGTLVVPVLPLESGKQPVTVVWSDGSQKHQVKQFSEQLFRIVEK